MAVTRNLRRADVLKRGLLTVARLGLAYSLAACAGRSERLESERDRGSAGRGNEGASVCGVTGGRASSGFEIEFASSRERISVAVEREDGSLLAFRPNELLSIARGGEVTVLEPAPRIQAALASGQPLRFAPRGQAMLLIEAGTHGFVFDGEATSLLSTFAAPTDQVVLYDVFSDSGELLALTYGGLLPDRSFPSQVEVRRLDGSVISSTVPRARNPVLPASDDRMIFQPGPNEGQLVVTTLEQHDLYRVDVGSDVRTVGVSEDGNVLALQLAANEVVHVSDGIAQTPYLPDAAVRYLRLAPGGRWTVFSQASPGRIHLFDAGNWLTARALPLDTIHDFDVNDDGDVVVAGQDASGVAQVLLLDSNLEVQFTCAGDHDAGDYGPSVRFTRDDLRVIAVFDDRLSVFSVR